MTPKCPVCGEGGSREVEKYGVYTLRLCPGCDLVFSDPMKSELSYYKESVDYAFRDRVMLDPLVWDFRWEMEEFLKSPPRKVGRLLDIGCGTGFFVKRALDMGFDAYGLDFNPESISRGRRHFGITSIYPTDLAGFLRDVGGPGFDVVTLFHLMEHVEDPNRLIEDIKPVLNDDAAVVIALPYRDRWPDPYGGDGDSPPHHLTRWSLKSMENFLDRHGFAVRKCKVESFPLRNMPGLLYHHVLRLAPFLTIKGSGVALKVEAPERAEAEDILRKRKMRMTLATALGSPLWIVLKALGARGPNLYIEAAIKK